MDRSLENDRDAILLRKMINKDFKYNLLAMMSNLEKIDSIILTGGMSAKNKEQREMFMSNLENFGILLDKNINEKTFDKEEEISKKESNIKIHLIPTDEEKEIAKQSMKILKRGN